MTVLSMIEHRNTARAHTGIPGYAVLERGSPMGRRARSTTSLRIRRCKLRPWAECWLVQWRGWSQGAASQMERKAMRADPLTEPA